MHVFKFATTEEGLVLKSDVFEQLKPGLGDSGWATEPARAAASLGPLLKKAIAAVPAKHRATTPIELRATAGLRLLPGGAADQILDEVGKVLAESPFMVIPEGVSIMDGVDEGAYAWLTLNYLLGNTGKPMEQLVGAIDLGGGSIQQAFAVPEKVASGAPPGASFHRPGPCSSPTRRQPVAVRPHCTHHRPLNPPQHVQPGLRPSGGTSACSTM